MASNGNFCTMNPLMGLDDDGTSKLTFSNGNLRAENTANGIQTMGTMAVKSGKWYYEEKYDADANINDARLQVGVQALGNFSGLYDGEIYIKRRSTSARSQGTHVYYLRPNYQGGKLSHPTSLSWDYGNNDSGSSNTGIRVNAVGDIYMIALDLDNYKLYIGRNGTWYSNNTAGATGSNTDITQVDGWAIESTWQGSFWTPVLWIAGASSGTAGYFNFGQDSTFGGQISAGGNQDSNSLGDFAYSVPSGYLAWNTSNLPISDDIDPAQTDDNFPQKNFNTVLYTGTGSSNAISGLGFQPDLVWLKQRGSSGSNMLLDTNRGTNARLSSNNSNDERTASSYFTSFDSDGFTVTGNDSISNVSSGTFVGWCWRANGGTTATNNDGSITSTVQANIKAGFSIVTYTGSGSTDTIGHGLTQKPDFIITKNRDGAYSWTTTHKSMNSGGEPANNGRIYLNSTGAYGVGNNLYDFGSFTNSVFAVNGGDNNLNASGSDYVSYVWHSVEGYSNFGSYVGNGSTNGPFIYTGFRPRMIFVKRSSTTGGWWVFDSARDTFNPVNKYVGWHDSGSESSGSNFDFTSAGFKLRTSDGDFNGSGSTIIYGAWGDVPFKYNNTF